MRRACRDLSNGEWIKYGTELGIVARYKESAIQYAERVRKSISLRRSAGDTDHGELPEYLAELITDETVADITTLIEAASIDRSYDIPYLANRSEDGKTVYIDRNIPDQMEDGDITFDPAETLPWHEITEWWFMHVFADEDGNQLEYEPAHLIATEMERRKATDLGLDWDRYQENFDGYIVKLSDETIKRVPADLDMSPYQDEDDVAAIKEIQAAQPRGYRMSVIRKVMPAQIKALGDDEVEVTMSTGDVARDGHIFMPQGAKLDNYRKNPVVLWQHDPDHPVARADSIQVNDNNITALIRFAPSGVAQKSDEVRGLVKSGIISGVSVGIEPLEMEPLDPKKPRGGQRVLVWELLECSFVSIPADTGATVTARAVNEKYDGKELAQNQEKTGMSKRIAKSKHTRALARAPKVPAFKRGLYDVAQLAYLLEQLGYVQNSSEWESEFEDDDSNVPAMLAESMKSVADALLAMTAEEVAELLAQHEVDDIDTEGLPGEGRAFIADGKTPAVRAWRYGIAQARMGKTLSASNEKKLADAQGHHERAAKHLSAAQEHREAVGNHIETARSDHAKAVTLVGKMGDAMQSAKDDPAKASEHLDRAAKHHKALSDHMDNMDVAHSDMADRNKDAEDSHQALGRSLKAAQRSVRSVVEDSTPEGDDADSKTIQKSDSTEEDAGSRSLKRRQKELTELSRVAVGYH